MSFPEPPYSGAPYVQGPTSPAPTGPIYVQSGPQQYTTQQFVPPQYGPPTGGFPLPSPKKKRRTGLIVAWSIFGVLFVVVFIGVVGAIAASTNKKPAAATQTSAGAVQHCDHGHLADGSCAGGNEPVAQNAAYLEVVRPLVPGVTDEKLTELGTTMCDALDRNGGDVGQLVNVDSGISKDIILKVAQAAGRYLCPQWMTQTQAYTIPAAPPKAANTIDDGTWTVGEDIPAGTYKTTGSGSECYWSITKTGSNGDDIINNHIGGGNLRVTLKKGQDFETDGCGTWTKIK